MFPRVCLRNRSVDTLHKGDTEGDNNNNGDINNNNNFLKYIQYVGLTKNVLRLG